jgi:hypothetical protein
MVTSSLGAKLSGFKEFRLLVPIAVVLSIAVTTIDIQVSNVSDFLHKFVTSDVGILLFSVEVIVFWIAQTIVMLSIRSKIREIKFGGKKFSLIEKIMPPSLILMMIFNLILLTQIVLLHQYFIVYLLLLVCISYGLNVILMGYLSYVFLSWHRRKSNKILIFFGISSFFATLSGILTMIFMGGVIIMKDSVVNSESHVLFPIYNIASIFGIINYINTYMFMAAFIFMWIGTGLLFGHYYAKLGRFKFFLMVISPLVFFIAQFFTAINFLFPFIDSSSLDFVFSYSLIFSFSSLIGSIIFGAGFWLLGRSVSDRVRSYLNVSGYGVIMFFTSATATVIHAPFPAFGIVAISLVGFSSYLLVYGLYCTAISISQDVDLRKRIRKSAEAHVRLLDNIGSAQLQDQIETKVSQVAHVLENELKEESGIPPSISQDELKDYVKSVIKEIAEKK